MPSWNDLNHLWSTLTEVDTNAIRAQVQTPFRVAILGSETESVQWLADALRTDPFSGELLALPRTLWTYGLPLEGGAPAEAAAADVALFVLPADGADPAQELRAYAALGVDNLAQAVVVLHLAVENQSQRSSAEGGNNWGDAVETWADPHGPDPLAAGLFPTFIKLFPGRQVGLAHHIPALRAVIPQQLIGETSLSNAGYAASTGLAEIIPVLNIPFNVADLVVLTKNQALLAYKVALALGQDISAQEMAVQLAGVLGGGFVWRELARRLVGFIPVWGLIPKVAVAYAGTYVTGMAVLTWYGQGRKLTPARMRGLYAEALAEGKARATALVLKRRPQLRLPAVSLHLKSARCPDCGKRLRRKDYFCAYCGAENV